MTYRNNNNNNNRRNNQGGNFNNNNSNNYGGTISRGNVNPWLNDGPNMGNMSNMGGGRGGGNNDALALANNLLNNLLRNQNQNNVPPSLLDMGGPHRGGYNEGPRNFNDFRVSTSNCLASQDVHLKKKSEEKAKLLIDNLCQLEAR